jgi:hypothetical protein
MEINIQEEMAKSNILSSKLQSTERELGHEKIVSKEANERLLQSEVKVRTLEAELDKMKRQFLFQQVEDKSQSTNAEYNKPSINPNSSLILLESEIQHYKRSISHSANDIKFNEDLCMELQSDIHLSISKIHKNILDMTNLCLVDNKSELPSYKHRSSIDHDMSRKYPNLYKTQHQVNRLSDLTSWIEEISSIVTDRRKELNQQSNISHISHEEMCKIVRNAVRTQIGVSASNLSKETKDEVLISGNKNSKKKISVNKQYPKENSCSKSNSLRKHSSLLSISAIESKDSSTPNSTKKFHTSIITPSSNQNNYASSKEVLTSSKSIASNSRCKNSSDSELQDMKSPTSSEQKSSSRLNKDTDDSKKRSTSTPNVLGTPKSLSMSLVRESNKAINLSESKINQENESIPITNSKPSSSSTNKHKRSKDTNPDTINISHVSSGHTTMTERNLNDSESRKTYLGIQGMRIYTALYIIQIKFLNEVGPSKNFTKTIKSVHTKDSNNKGILIFLLLNSYIFIKYN